MFRVTLLPAGHGDCIWIEYGPADEPHHVLIDAGTPGTYKRLKKAIKRRFANGAAHFELFVITHIDADHIGGAVKLLEDEQVTYDDIWFNGLDHLHGRNPREFLGSKQAELVTQSIVDRHLPWNEAFGGAAAMVKTWPTKKKLPGGLELTLLSPYQKQLTALIPAWEKELREAGLLDQEGNRIAPKERRGRASDELGGEEPLDMKKLLAAKFESDTAAANGSSIAFLAEYDGKRALFTGDAHVSVLLESLMRLQPSGAIPVDLVKVAHHGAGGNTSAELLRRLACVRYAISTNGSYFKHPERTAVARILKYGGRRKKRLLFNYSTDFNSIWNADGLKATYKYETSYPADADRGAVIEL